MINEKKKAGNKNFCLLTMFPAMAGDCFLLEFESDGKIFRMMIDSGTVTFGQECLKKVLDGFKPEEKIDLLVITHCDADHIGGVLTVLRDSKYSGRIVEIWHNGLVQIAPELPEKSDENSSKKLKRISQSIVASTAAITGPTSIKQAKYLARLTTEQEIKINGIVNGQAIMTDLAGKHIGPNEDIEVFFLLPQKRHLDELLELFRKKLPLDVTISATEVCQECFDKLMPIEQAESYSFELCASEWFKEPNVEKWVQKIEEAGWKQDTSKTNASSIAIIIRYNGKKLLFAGDAWGQDLSAALKQWQKDNDEDNLYFDVVKLPHHGSYRNCMDLLEIKDFDGKLFLVSTDGRKHDHPSKETLAKIVARPTLEERILAFNYKHAMYKLFSHEQSQMEFHYRVVCEEQFPEFEVKN